MDNLPENPASLERARKIERCAALRAQGKSALWIADALKLPHGTVKKYLQEVREQEKRLAETMDPAELADKKAEIIQGLEHDLAEANELYAVLKAGQKVPITAGQTVVKDKAGRIKYKSQRNEMACVSCLKHITEIRCKLAGLYGLNTIEMTVTTKKTHEIIVRSALGAPSAMKPTIAIPAEVVGSKALNGENAS